MDCFPIRMLAEEILYSLLFAILPALGIWIVIFCSPLLTHAYEKFIAKAPSTEEDMRQWLMNTERWKLLQLYDCRWCQAFWTSVLASIFFNEFSLWWPLHVAWTALTFYPIIAFAVWTLSKPNN